MAAISEEAIKLAKEIATEKDADVFLYSEGIDREKAHTFCCAVKHLKKRRKNAILILTTLGGDPDAAYLIARCLQRHYGKFAALIFGHCKSAGTLIVVGASDIGISDHGELGPLDIQLGKEDEIFKRSSGLDLSEAISYLKDLSWQLFLQNFVRLKRGSTITTKTAAEIAEALAVGIIGPISSQIDPLRLGEVQRAMRIVKDYGMLLNPTFPSFDKLITYYPSHSFIIDREQAKGLFQNVREPNEKELALSKALGDIVLQSNEQIEFLSPQDEPPKPPTSTPPKHETTTDAGKGAGQKGATAAAKKGK